MATPTDPKGNTELSPPSQEALQRISDEQKTKEKAEREQHSLELMRNLLASQVSPRPLDGGSTVAQPTVPLPSPILAWQLVKQPGVNTYDALVGEPLWMYGTYFNIQQLADGPTLFSPFEVYERAIRRALARIHLARRPYVYAPSPAQTSDQRNYFGVPAFAAPSPHKPRGTLYLQFTDDQQNRSSGLLKVYFKGTASVTFHPKVGVSASAQPGPVPTITGGVSAEFRSFERTASIEPVREDPEVSARIITGPELADYLAGYLDHIVEQVSERTSIDRERIQDDIFEYLGRASNAVPNDLVMVDPPVFDNVALEPGQPRTLTVVGHLEPGQSGMLAIETTTREGRVMSDVLELVADDQGQIYDL